MLVPLLPGSESSPIMKTNQLLKFSFALSVLVAGASGYLYFGNSSPSLVPAAPVAEPSPSPSSGVAATPALHSDRSVKVDHPPISTGTQRATRPPERKKREVTPAKTLARVEQNRPAIAARLVETQLSEEPPLAQELSETAGGNEGNSVMPTALPVQSTVVYFQKAPPATTKKAGTVDPASLPQLPAILVAPDPQTPMSQLQETEWSKIEKDFITDIGGTNQDVNDPTYPRRWQTAQEKADAMFRLKYGTEAFLRYNAEAGRQGAK